MYRVALVQNQSEMAHYSYADCRALLASTGYKVAHFTGDDIAELLRQMSGERLDALILASNALNDPYILEALCNEEFAKLLADFLRSGRGLLSFQQLGLAMRRGPAMSLLPKPLCEVTPVVRPSEEPLESGNPRPPAGARHLLLHYPNDLAGKPVGKSPVSTLSGKYWHYWEHANLADWDVLLEDADRPGAPRPLLISTKESSEMRVVLSALPLDWQRHSQLTENLFLYVVEGRHNTAVLIDPADETVSCSYLLASLRTRRLGIAVYCLPDDCDSVIRNIENDVHSSVVMQPGVQDRLPEGLRKAIADGAGERRLRVMSFAEVEGGIRPFAVLSAELAPNRLLHMTELQIHSDLEIGYVDDSFWGHVETLQTLVNMKRSVDYGPYLSPAWKIVANHDRNGSYDEVFGATVALWWMRAHYLGPDNPATKRSERWLAGAMSAASARDRAMAYLTFNMCGELDAEGLTDLESILAGVPGRLETANDSDKTVYLRSALAIGKLEVVPQLIDSLEKKQDADGKWLDLQTTASVTSALLDAHVALGRASTADEPTEAQAQIEGMALKAMIYILDQLDRSSLGGDSSPLKYPWRGKASTSILCLRAWLQFDALIDIPIFEVVESLGRLKKRDNESISSLTELSVLEHLKSERDRLKEQRDALTGDVQHAGNQVKLLKRTRFVLFVLIYLLITVISGTWREAPPDLASVLEDTFVRQWGVHIGALMTFAALLKLPWRSWLGLEDDTGGSAKPGPRQATQRAKAEEREPAVPG